MIQGVEIDQKGLLKDPVAVDMLWSWQNFQNLTISDDPWTEIVTFT